MFQGILAGKYIKKSIHTSCLHCGAIDVPVFPNMVAWYCWTLTTCPSTSESYFILKHDSDRLVMLTNLISSSLMLIISRQQFLHRLPFEDVLNEALDYSIHSFPEAYKYSHALYPLPVLYRKQFCFIYSNILSRTPRLAWDFYESNNHAHSRLCAQYYLKNCTTFIQ